MILLTHLAAERPIVNLDNYEAIVNYFPIEWRPEVSPFLHLSNGNGLENMPPSIAIRGYELKTHVKIDYILMWCFRPDFLKDPDFGTVYSEIMAGYHLVYGSRSRRTMLWQRN